MSIIKDDWEKPRSRSQHLTKAEIAMIGVAYRCGRKPRDIARELKCSTRVAAKYFSMFRGDARPTKPKIIVQPRPQPAVAARARFYKSNFEL